MMELRDVSAGYRGRPASHHIDLRLTRGSLTVLIGPNGSGKSTLLRAMAGLLSPLTGGIWLEGREAARYTPRQWARRVALLPQMRSVPALTAGQLVMHGRYPYLAFPRTLTQQDQQAARQALERVGAEGLTDRPLQTLSGGERQRVYLAMLLAQQADLLLLDEPATYLDIGHQLEMLALIRTLSDEGKTLVVVMHDLTHALELGGRICLLEEGRITAQGDGRALLPAIERAFTVRALTLRDGRGRDRVLFEAPERVKE